MSSTPSSPGVLVVLAHPDDPEFFCGGTLALWAQQGSRISYCLLTRGDKGDDNGSDPSGLAAIRELEQRAAAQVLGVNEVAFLNYPDGYLVPDLDLRREVVRAGLSVLTTIPWVTGSVHEVIGRRAPCTSTRHKRQPPYGVKSG